MTTPYPHEFGVDFHDNAEKINVELKTIFKTRGKSMLKTILKRENPCWIILKCVKYLRHGWMLLIVFISEAVHLQKSETWIKDINISNFTGLHCKIKGCVFNSIHTQCCYQPPRWCKKNKRTLDQEGSCGHLIVTWRMLSPSNRAKNCREIKLACIEN